MNTPIIANLIPRLRETVTQHLKSYIGGEGELSSIQDSLEFWWDGMRDREFPELCMWSDLPAPDRDALFDAWIEALEDLFAARRGKPGGSSNAHSAPALPAGADVLPAWRELQVGEILQEGDEGFYGGDVWKPISEYSVGDELLVTTWKVRRRVSSPAAASSPSPLSGATGQVKASPGASVCEVEPGDGWRLLQKGEPLQDGDGFLHPDFPAWYWISYDCRPDVFRGPGKEHANWWPWRRKIEAPTTSQKGA